MEEEEEGEKRRGGIAALDEGFFLPSEEGGKVCMHARKHFCTEKMQESPGIGFKLD